MTEEVSDPPLTGDRQRRVPTRADARRRSRHSTRPGRFRRLLHLTLPGCWGAVVFAALSLTPSLLPRGGFIQGLVCGITAAIGYGVGVLVAWLWRAYADRDARVPTRSSWRAFLIIAGAVLVVVLRPRPVLAARDPRTDGGRRSTTWPWSLHRPSSRCSSSRCSSPSAGASDASTTGSRTCLPATSVDARPQRPAGCSCPSPSTSSSAASCSTGW